MINIAFCPTMQPFAEKLAQIEGINMVPLQSAGQSLAMLKSGRVQGALIGRYAKRQEIDSETQREILKGGCTLVYRVKTAIREDDLKNIAVNTYLDEGEIQPFQALIGEIHHFDSLEACLNDQLQTPVLINWQEYRDDFELLIPMNAHGKTPLFRAPVLYAKGIDAAMIKRIREAIQ